MKLYTSVTDYVRLGFNTAKRTNNSATGLIMILFQRLVSSSTAAILSAMEGRLERLRNGEENGIENYSGDIDASLEEYETNFDFNGLYQNDATGLVDEEAILCELIKETKECMGAEVDAKADALLQKYKELQLLKNNKELKILIFTEFRTTQKMLLDFFKSNGYKCSGINGSQDLDERKRALSNFKNDNQILVATDAAGESLNMQFCHIVFNYDLPWNPMMIEQRIGRVDRIGQKEKVQAYNILTNNSVDLRVYEVIEEKLNNIIEQLGIDKTSDVLDSAIDMKKVNKLYLQSLLDPEKFEFAGEKWLHEIKAKLREYQSTEGILPNVEESEIEQKKAAEIKHSPLPQWLESLTNEYVVSNGGKSKKNLLGYTDIKLNEIQKKITFDSEIAIDNPGIEHLTLQHDWVRKILNDISEFNANNGIPVIQSVAGEETSGYWSLWEIKAKNHFEKKIQYQCFFIADNGKQYLAYANDIWNRLIDGSLECTIATQKEFTESNNLEKQLEEHLFVVFQNLEAQVIEKMKFKKVNKINSYQFQRARIEKIGIGNIKQSKLKRIDTEQDQWLKEFQVNQKVIPGIKQLITIRING